MNKKYLLALLTGLLFIPVVYASGPYLISRFSDVPQGAWFSDAVYHLEGNVIQGYNDGTFRPANNVTRAEFAVMLDRFWKFLERPSGDDAWQIHEGNGGYSIAYPAGWIESSLGSGSGFDRGINVGPRAGEDFRWGVKVHNSSEKSMEQLIADIGKQFEGKRRESRENFVLNGLPATKVIVTTTDIPSWYAENVFVQWDTRIFEISNGAVKDVDFELFYRSFEQYYVTSID